MKVARGIVAIVIAGGLTLLMSAPVESQTQDQAPVNSQGPALAPAGPINPDTAPALQTAIHRFAKPWWKLRAVNLFRDGTGLAAAHDLSGAIKTAS